MTFSLEHSDRSKKTSRRRTSSNSCGSSLRIMRSRRCTTNAALATDVSPFQRRPCCASWTDGRSGAGYWIFWGQGGKLASFCASRIPFTARQAKCAFAFLGGQLMSGIAHGFGRNSYKGSGPVYRQCSFSKWEYEGFDAVWVSVARCVRDRVQKWGLLARGTPTQLEATKITK